LEVVKTRLQSKQFTAPAIQVAGINGSLTNFRTLTIPLRVAVSHVNGTVSVLKSVAVNEGIGALWKGIGATFVGVIPARAIYFSAYSKGKHYLGELNGGNENSPLVHLGAAAIAGISTSTATNPVWLIKTRMQLQSSTNRLYSSSWNCLISIIRNEGFKSLYKGLGASYLGVIESSMQWVIYEHLKKGIQKRPHHRADSAWIEFFGAAGAAKLIAAVIAYPHEVLRTRMREETNNSTRRYKSLLQTARLILKEEGAGAFYGGMTAHLMRVVPNSAIMFFCYEFLIHAYSKVHTDN
jgi:solute carrier family 25, member 33/36